MEIEFENGSKIIAPDSPPSSGQVLRDSFIHQMAQTLNETFSFGFDRWLWIRGRIPGATTLSALNIRSNEDALDLIKYLYGKYQDGNKGYAELSREACNLRAKVLKLKKKLKKARKK